MMLKRIFSIVMLFALVQCSIAITFQKKLLFHERKLSIDHHFESIYPYTEYMLAREVVNGDTIWINALYYLPEGDVRGCVFYLHGTLGNMQTQEKHLHDFLSRGYAVYTYDYRSYGKSTGSIDSEKQMHEDAAWMFDRCLETTGRDASEMIVVGRSLGTGMAVPLAAAYHPSMLLLITPYWQLADVAKRFIPYVPRPVIQKALKFNFAAEGIIEEVNCPVYVFHGTLDELIPFRSGRMFESYTSDNGSFIRIQGARHLNITRFDTFQDHISDILSN